MMEIVHHVTLQNDYETLGVAIHRPHSPFPPRVFLGGVLGVHATPFLTRRGRIEAGVVVFGLFETVFTTNSGTADEC